MAVFCVTLVYVVVAVAVAVAGVAGVRQSCAGSFTKCLARPPSIITHFSLAVSLARCLSRSLTFLSCGLVI